MKYLLLLVALLVLAGSASAQTVHESSIVGASSSLDRAAVRHMNPTRPEEAFPLADDITLSYYDASKPIIRWPVPVTFSPLLFVAYGQRMTLPTDYGFVDSARVRLGKTQGDSVFISIVKDTLFDVGNGQFAHLIDLWEDNPDYERVSVAIKDTQPGGWLTARFDHVLVPKQFHVVIDPYVNEQGQATSGFEVLGDSGDVKPLTTEEARSVFIALTPQDQYLSALLDGVVQFDGWAAPAFTNFYMEAFVDMTSSSVATDPSQPVAVFPNPVTSGTFTVSNDNPISAISMRDILGNEVLAWSGMSTSVELRTLWVPKGIYTLEVRSASGIRSSKVIVQ